VLAFWSARGEVRVLYWREWPKGQARPSGAHARVTVKWLEEVQVADHKVHDLTPEEVSKGMAEGRYLLVDVREPNEVAAEAYPGGVVVPLSTFDPKGIPDPQGKQVVFACRSGKRSVTASLAAQAAGLPYDQHLAGGILGWKAAGLPTKTGG
jgi:rhodanese-related sulfurtransferase